eukprot:TRINITY_DN1979_c1_g2_i1.p1 TRINITY_DN1979_c1_g2~~TRINITY_DN1979_c1_g2_i1.p1  ORF type:complete len:334 (-),score=145.99 TRINITY_DN1979_c1_g2_i1:159-1160(-)
MSLAGKIATTVQKSGSGGRSSFAGSVISVFGSSGFIGTNLVNSLGRTGSQIIVAYRGEPKKVNHLKPLGDLGQIVPINYDIKNPDSVYAALSKSSTVVNLIGKRWSTKSYTINEGNNLTAGELARIAKQAGVQNFIHLSTLGVREDGDSEWLIAKQHAEYNVLKYFPEATIIRTGPVYGHNDRFITTTSVLARINKFAILRGSSIIQPICIDDLISTLNYAIKYSVTGVYNVASDQIYTYENLLKVLLEITKLDRGNDTKYFTQPYYLYKMFLYNLLNQGLTNDEIRTMKYPLVIPTNEENHLGLFGVTSPIQLEQIGVAYLRYLRPGNETFD